MIRLGPEVCRRIDEALTREWLVTNGLGGYASAAVTGTPTRRYHGLLVAAGRPPGGRRVMVAQCDELLTYAGRPYQISTTEYEDGTLSPAGYIHVAECRLERGLPATVYEIGDTTLEKWVWMAYGRNTTYVRYRLAATASEPVELRLRPLLSGRELHTLTRAQPGQMPAVEAGDSSCVVWPGGTLPLRLCLPGGRFEAQPDVYWRVLYRRERERGHDFVEDLFSPGTLAVRLAPGGEATLMLSAEAPDRSDEDGAVAWRLEWRRRGELAQRAGLPAEDGLGRALVLAADAFVVAHHGTRGGRSVLAGYHWLGESGREALIGLPGLMLTTGRAADARATLTTWLAARHDGLLPAAFKAEAGEPEYAAADVSLWLFTALRAYLHAGGDRTLLAEVWPALVEIVAAHERGTAHGIGVDPADGLLRASDPGAALTWMNARAGELVTPRRGKPVEVNALWYNALRQMQEWADQHDPAAAERYARAADWAATSFNRRFWYAPGGYLYDVVDGEAGDDLALRPNQILAVGLPFPVLARDRWRPVLDTVTDHLLTPFGLRTLSPADPRYMGWYAGDPRHRELARHQGTVAPWLLGPYGDAYERVYHDRAALRQRLKVFEKVLRVAGLGTISELFDGDAPHSPQGCIAGAAEVGEVLRLWRLTHEPADSEA